MKRNMGNTNYVLNVMVKNTVVILPKLEIAQLAIQIAAKSQTEGCSFSTAF